MAARNIHPQLKEKLVAQAYGDLSRLASKANLIEQSIQEKELRRANKGRGFNLISLVNFDEENGDILEEEVKIMVAEILQRKPYSCPALKPGKNRGITRYGKFEYDFDIKSKSDFLSFDKRPANST